MNSLIPIFIFGFVTLGIYKVFELFVRQKERMAIIEKIHFDLMSESPKAHFNLSLFNYEKQFSFWSLRGGLLLIGIGVGLLLGFILETNIIPYGISPQFSSYDRDVQTNISDIISIVYMAPTMIFGGLGLICAYIIEQKNIKKNQD